MLVLVGSAGRAAREDSPSVLIASPGAGAGALGSLLLLPLAMALVLENSIDDDSEFIVVARTDCYLVYPSQAADEIFLEEAKRQVSPLTAQDSTAGGAKKQSVSQIFGVD